MVNNFASIISRLSILNVVSTSTVVAVSVPPTVASLDTATVVAVSVPPT